jgi:DNA-directed RNA polymerase subunit RPC12/RpoP
MRLIDADALAAELLKYPLILRHHGDFVAVNLDAVLAEIRRAPTIDPESLRPQGAWMDVYGGKYANPRYACTNCGEKALYAAKGKQKSSKSCPNCGAKMYISEDIKR